MKTALLGLLGLTLMAVPLKSADAWMASSSRGTASGNGNGTWQAHGYQGGSASGSGGSWSGHNAYGGSASGGEGNWHATSGNGTTYSGGYHSGGSYYGGSYYGAYHPPTTVNYYGSSCSNCGGWNTGGAAAVGLVAGVAIGASTANANNAAAQANAYSAGVVAGAAAQPAYVMNDIYAVLPPGCAYKPFAGNAYYQCGAAWLEPAYGANGVYYRVVPVP
jgi:hypothetical protein